MNLARRQLLERPFRRFADFGGRAGRAEFWMFVLVFVVLTELAWLAGYGGAALVPANDVDGTSATIAADPAEQTVDSRQTPAEMDADDTDEVGDILVKLHRHAGDEDWHFHGRVNLDEGAEFFHHDLTGKDRMHHEWRKHWHDHDESHAKWLNKEGYLTVRGKKFRGAHVHSILKKRLAKEELLNREYPPVWSDFSMEVVDKTVLMSDFGF